MDTGWAFYEAVIDENGNVGPYFDREPDFSLNPNGQIAYGRAMKEMTREKRAVEQSNARKRKRP